MDFSFIAMIPYKLQKIKKILHLFLLLNMYFYLIVINLFNRHYTNLEVNL